MRDPYVDADGNSYEKEAIFDWVRTNPVSPITRNSLQLSQLVPNRALKEIITEYRRQNNIGDKDVGEAKDAKYTGARADDKAGVEAVLDRKPLMIFALIDTSGSMGTSCGANADGESDGYNRMDLVKHTLNTIITSLTAEDKICIIEFSTVARIFAQLTNCTNPNKKLLIERVKQIDPDGQTNIWDALRLTVDQIAAQGAYGLDFNVDVYLLTDGEPNINPVGPIVTTLQKYMRAKLENCAKPRVSTFGYGYNLNSSMLYDISQAADGVFGFIPDSTMVGTVFINALSHSLVGSAGGRAEPQAGEEIGEFDSVEERDQEVVIAKAVAMLDAVAESASATGSDLQSIVTEFLTWVNAYKSELEEKATIDGEDRRATIAFVSDLIIDCTTSADANNGQIMKAAQADFYAKWGRHYLRSVSTAFKRRVCINFKDKAMQHFKSAKFLIEQERVENVFICLPPPTPSIREYGRSFGAAPAAASRQPASMTSYYNNSGGCFTGDSLVYVVTDEGLNVEVKVCDLKRGMRVLSATTTAAVPSSADDSSVKVMQYSASAIECMVQLRYTGDLYPVGGMTLTPYHPVMLAPYESTGSSPSPRSYFPVERPQKGAKLAMDGGWVFDLVLENRGLIVSPYPMDGPSSQVQMMCAATFGHNCKNGVFQHDYFGAERIVDDLRKQDGWQDGLVRLDSYRFVREEGTNLVTSLEVSGSRLDVCLAV